MIKKKIIKTIKKYEQKHYILTAIIIGFAIVLFWRGAWMLIDMIIFPNNQILSATVSIILGCLLLYMRDFDLKEII